MLINSMALRGLFVPVFSQLNHSMAKLYQCGRIGEWFLVLMGGKRINSGQGTKPALKRSDALVSPFTGKADTQQRILW